MGRKRERSLDKASYQRVYQRARYFCVHKRGYKPHSEEYKQCMKECMDEEAKKEKTHFISIEERMKEQEQQAQRRKAMRPKENPEFEKGEPIFKSYDIVRQLPRGSLFTRDKIPLTKKEKEDKVSEKVRQHGKVDYDEIIRMLEEEEEE